MPTGVNPSHLMNLFTYEKGYCFVYYLSQLCGDPQRFDEFLRVSTQPLGLLPFSPRVGEKVGRGPGAQLEPRLLGCHLLPLPPLCLGPTAVPSPLGQLRSFPLTQAYVEKYKFTSVVAQDLLDSFLSFFPELKEQSVDCRAGKTSPADASAARIPAAPGRQDKPLPHCSAAKPGGTRWA